MKKLLALCAGTMLMASAALAQTNGVQLAWNNCANTTGNSPTAAFACDPEAGDVYTMHATFSLGTAQAGVLAVDNIIDFIYPGTPTGVPAFWQFQEGGCNGGLVLAHAKPAGSLVCNSANLNTLCGSGGTGCQSFITAYVLGDFGGTRPGPNRARLFISVARGAPVTLSAARFYAFNLNFLMDNALACSGCGDVVDITFNTARVLNSAAVSGGEGIAVDLQSTDPGSQPNVSANGSGGEVPTRAKSWGMLKSLYR